MELDKIINKTISEYLLEREVLDEYITNDEIYLRDYLMMSDSEKKEYLPHEYHYFFDDFFDEEGIDFQTPKEMRPTNYQDDPYEEVDMFENTDELITYLENENKDLYDKFATYLYRKIRYNELPIEPSDYPAWSFFDNSPELIKNQWLIHFTTDADSIAQNGFLYGVDDMTKLGLTTHLGEFDKNYGGYNFAYLLSDFPKYYSSFGRHKYGNEAVVFNASGIRVWHNGDEEPQVIFYGNTATNIIPITENNNGGFAIFNKRTGEPLFESDDLKSVVNWLVKNYQQYRKSIYGK